MLPKIAKLALGFALASAASVPAGNAQVTEQTVRLFVSAEPVAGTLTLPAGSDDVPGVLILLVALLGCEWVLRKRYNMI